MTNLFRERATDSVVKHLDKDWSKRALKANSETYNNKMDSEMRKPYEEAARRESNDTWRANNARAIDLDMEIAEIDAEAKADPGARPMEVGVLWAPFQNESASQGDDDENP